MSSKSLNKLVLLLCILTLLTPYFIIEQSLLGGGILRIVAPIWSLVSYSDAPFVFEFPIGFFIDFLPFWGLGFVIAGVVHLSVDRNELTKIGYIIMVAILLMLQLVYFVVIILLPAGGPPTVYTPLPIVAMIGIILTPLIERPPPPTWEYQPISERSLIE